MKIPNKIASQLKEQRLNVYRSRYFELQMDAISLKASIEAGVSTDKEGLDLAISRMKAIQVAYDAIESIVIEEDDKSQEGG